MEPTIKHEDECKCYTCNREYFYQRLDSLKTSISQEDFSFLQELLKYGDEKYGLAKTI